MSGGVGTELCTLSSDDWSDMGAPGNRRRIGCVLGRGQGGEVRKRLQGLCELQYGCGGGCDAFECCGAVSNHTHEFVCWGEGGVSYVFILEMNIVTEPFGSGVLDMAVVNSVVLR